MCKRLSNANNTYDHFICNVHEPLVEGSRGIALGQGVRAHKPTAAESFLAFVRQMNRKLAS